MSSLEISQNKNSPPLLATSGTDITPSITAIRQFAFQHLIAAALFTKNCDEIERDNEGKLRDNFSLQDVCPYASGAIMSSVAGIEGYINEEYLLDDSLIKKAIPNFEEEFYNKEHPIEKKPILWKYKYALKVLKNQKLDEKSKEAKKAYEKAYKKAYNLIELRNTLMHFKPSYDKKYQKVGLQEALKDEFKMSSVCHSSVAVSDSEFATVNCMTYSCGEWAVKTCCQFIDTFSSLAGIPNRLTKRLDKLTTGR